MFELIVVLFWSWSNANEAMIHNTKLNLDQNLKIKIRQPILFTNYLTCMLWCRAKKLILTNIQSQQDRHLPLSESKSVCHFNHYNTFSSAENFSHRQRYVTLLWIQEIEIVLQIKNRFVTYFQLTDDNQKQKKPYNQKKIFNGIVLKLYIEVCNKFYFSF